MLDSNGVASITVSGIMANRIGMLEKLCGGCDYQDLQRLPHGLSRRVIPMFTQLTDF
jgi:hypothetical protein